MWPTIIKLDSGNFFESWDIIKKLITCTVIAIKEVVRIVDKWTDESFS